MLKALELIGFKSFADKTRFEFPPGITVVVGPNGSGKSNIVDAIKWVLGEQSVKTLRGKEMADVIFNGSGSRKAVNAAEVTLTFDNTQNLLAIDTPEVHITRRVYRSGEGEYMINRQPCRLRDIRDLFAGTGAATEAYSVIEQGKVDVLLQSSPRDRRVIFEEAAGISRFKAKKLEAMRRLERVDQNLLRLSDIVDEVDSRLRNTRLQAGKARRYKQYSDRLQQLRTQVGLTDWRAATRTLETLESELQSIRDQASQWTAEIEAGEFQAQELEQRLIEADGAIRLLELQIGQNRERIASNEATIDHQRQLSHDLEEEVARHRRHLTAMRTRAGDLQQQSQETHSALSVAQAEFARVQQLFSTDQAQLGELTRQLESHRQRSEVLRTQHLERMRSSASLGSKISALESQLKTAEQTLARSSQQSGELRQKQAALATELESERQTLSELTDSTTQLSEQLQAGRSQLTATRQMLADKQRELALLERRHNGAVERAAVLEELETRLEGLSLGVKDVLVRARESSEGPLRQIRGLVADLLGVSVDAAPLVEVALGELAHYLVIAPGEPLMEYLADPKHRFSGRVGFLWLDSQLPASPVDRINLDDQPGVHGRADRLVETAPEFVPLVRRLLGRTWIVESLQQARQLAAGIGKGLTFVTRSGELVGADGTFLLGPRQTATGLISRRSELRALRSTIADLAVSRADSEAKVARLDAEVSQCEQRTQSLATEHQEAASTLGEHRLRTSGVEQRLADLEQRLSLLDAEQQAALARQTADTTELDLARAKQAELETQLAAMETEMAAARTALAEGETQRAGLTRSVTELQIQLAKSEQQVDSLGRQMQQVQRDQQERDKALEESRTQLLQCQERIQLAQQSILRASSEVAEYYLRKEQLAAEVVSLFSQREQHRAARTELAGTAHGIRQRLRKLDDKMHAKELAANEVRHQRSTLIERLRDDYGIELAQLQNSVSADEIRERDQVDQEIGELRQKINNIGHVNLEALAELENLESRFGSLSAQFQDLSKAKASLEQIIGKINADSRRLFMETLETVRGHFQTLFRKLFGGGQADIVLDEGQDVLDSGIEIVARPPGKEPRSISLLSGGEKTLTCVALLLAIFRGRPSPFCVLDEVDAALDEANIERFVNVVKEFNTTQFVVVTHSKKTMTCASTLYGVTMQESGISKRVSVRFEDVSEDGHIRQSALEKATEQDETQAA